MNTLKKTTLSLLLLSSFSLFAQTTTNESQQKEIWNKPTVHQSDKILELLENSIKLSEEKPTIKGYRIQLFSESGANVKTKATAIQSECIKSYPEINAYVVFESPNFKVKAGDFRTQIEAQKYLKIIKATFPSAFIVTDDIALPKAD